MDTSTTANFIKLNKRAHYTHIVRQRKSLARFSPFRPDSIIRKHTFRYPPLLHSSQPNFGAREYRHQIVIDLN